MTCPARPASLAACPFATNQHCPALDCLEHLPEVVAALLGQPDVAVQGLAIQALQVGNGLGPLDVGLGQVAAGKGDDGAAGKQRVAVVAVLKQLVETIDRRGEDDCHPGWQAFQGDKQPPDGGRPKTVGRLAGR